jgi:integrase
LLFRAAHGRLGGANSEQLGGVMAGKRKRFSPAGDDSGGEVFVNLRDAPEWTLTHAFEVAIRPGVKNLATLKWYQRGIGHWKRYSGDPRLKDLTAEVAQRFVDVMLDERYSPATVQAVWNAVSSVIGHFHEKTNANRKALGILPGRAPAVTIPDEPADPSKRPGFDPLAMTVRAAWKKYVQPSIRTQGTLTSYETSLRVWEEIAGNLPLRDISNLTMDKFKAALTHDGLSAATVNKYLRTITRIFYRLGPQQHRHLDGLGILHRIPYTQPLPAPGKIPRSIKLPTLEAILRSCGVATWPQPERSGVDPVTFWRAVVVLAFNLGLRRGDLFGLRHDSIDLEERTVTLIAEKSGKVQCIPLNDAACDAIRTLWRPEHGPYLLYPTSSNRQLYREWHKIQTAAGIPEDQHVDPHDLRRTCATFLERIAAGAATTVLGHSSPAVTRRSYIDPSQAVRHAVESLPKLGCVVSPPADPPHPLEGLQMDFTLTRLTTDDGSGIFAAFARHGDTHAVELLLAGGDLRGDLTAAILREWSRAVLAFLFGDDVAEQHADALAASELVAPEALTPIDWEQEHLVLAQADVVRLVLDRTAPQSAAA